MSAFGTVVHSAKMNKKYARVRHVYDASRKYFLFGRDAAIDRLELETAKSVLEIGCGTGRNLSVIAKRNPLAVVHGVDISREMLKSASDKIKGLPNVAIAMSDASTLDTEKVLGHKQYSSILMSYTLSMMPDRKAALSRAIKAIAPGGRLVIVDFGNFEGYGRLGPVIVRALSAADAPPIPNLMALVDGSVSGKNHFKTEFGGSQRGYYRWAVVTRAERIS